MERAITQRELRNQSGKVMRALDSGESFILTRNGVPVGELVPFRRRGFVSTAAALGSLAKTGAIELKRFRADLDALVDQDPTPRG